MSTSMSKPLAKGVRFGDQTLIVMLEDGRELSIPLAYFPRLLHATTEQRQRVVVSGGGTGLHWDEIDEDILVENLFLGFGDTTKHLGKGVAA